MKFLLTNDDGVDAPGLAALHAATMQYAQRGDKIIVVAPDRGRSECGHSVTTGRGLTLTPRDDKTPQDSTGITCQWYCVDGTPVDCVRVALGSVATDADVVFSGINAGANLGACLLVSGTFAAAREAAFQRVPAMAISQLRHPDVPHAWDHASDWLQRIFTDFKSEMTTGTFSRPLWNVNLPAVAQSAPIPHTIECSVDQNPIPRTVLFDGDGDSTTPGVPGDATRQAGKALRFDLDFHGRPHEVGTDIHHCFAGAITVSKLAAVAG